MNDDDAGARRRRAEARRARMTIRRTTIDDDSDPHPVYGAEAISLTTQLSRMAWSLSGRPFPQYTRAEMPVRFVPRK